MAPPRSETHDIAVLRQDNGELEEDVVARKVTGGPEADRSMTPAGANRRRDRAETTGLHAPESDLDDAEEDEVDEAIAESFPASDPPGYWSGGGEPADGGDDAAAERVVARSDVEEVAERRHPDDPLPGSLPRPGGPGTDESRH